MKLAIYIPPPKTETEEESICTLGLNQKADGSIILNVVNPRTGVRLNSGTIMHFYLRGGKIKYKIIGGCYQGGIDDRIQLAQSKS